MVAVRVSGRFHSRGSRRRDGSAAPASGRATVASVAALADGESSLLASRNSDAGRDDDDDDAANRVRSFSCSSNDTTRHIGADDARRLEEGNASETKEANKTSSADTKNHGDRLHSHRNRDVGILGALRTVLFGARDPE
ncbi:unnamed protein product, partial [Scytosiphon promiscuus]